MPYLGTTPAAAALTAADIASSAVTTIKINDDAVTEAKMATDAIGLTELKAGTDGEIISWDASGNPVAIGAGTSGHFLKSQGAGSQPVFAAAAGEALSRYYDDYYTYTTSTSSIPADDTIPTSSEGTELCSITTDTLASTSSIIRVHWGGYFNCSSVGEMITAAIFDGGASAKLSATVQNGQANTYMHEVQGMGEWTPGATTALTISMRVGTTGGTIYFNGTNSARRLGGTLGWHLIVEEIEA